MNKNDFRLQFPLWNAGLAFLEMIFLYSVIYAIDMMNSDYKDLYRDGTFYYQFVRVRYC